MPLESERHLKWFDRMLESTLTVVAVILFVICLSLIVLGLVELVRGWSVMFSTTEIFEEAPSSILITGLGMIVIGIAVLDLTKSIMDEQIAETKFKNAQERARDFLTRFLAVIIFAISAEAFVLLARSNPAVNPGIFADAAMLGIAVGAMLGGLALYLKLTCTECDTDRPGRLGV